MRRMGGKAFFFHFLYAKDMLAITKNTHKSFQLKTNALSKLFTWNTTLKNIVQAVAKIIPTTAGRIPPSVAFTPAHFNNFVKSEAMRRMIINEGKTTPSVARSAPKIPPCEDPTKVAIFTAIGPGVDSATAMKFKSSFSVSQAFARQSSRIKEIIP